MDELSMNELLKKLQEFSEHNPNIPILDCIRNMRSLEIINHDEASSLQYFFDEDKIFRYWLKKAIDL